MPIPEKVRRSTCPWGNICLLLTAGVGKSPSAQPASETGIPAGRLCFDTCVTLRCWACTEPSQRRGENEATSLSSVRHCKESSQSFWAWFSPDHIYIHVYTHACMHFFLSFFFPSSKSKSFLSLDPIHCQEMMSLHLGGLRREYL